MMHANLIQLPERSDAAPLVLSDVSKIYEDTKALDRVSFTITAGEFVVLLGPSGAGKSTIFRCVTGLAKPETGSVEVLGTPINRLSGNQLRLLRRSIGLIFQQFNLIGRLSAIKNVLAGRLGYVPAWRVALRFFSTLRPPACACQSGPRRIARKDVSTGGFPFRRTAAARGDCPCSHPGKPDHSR